MVSERTIFSISEQEASGRALISSNDLPYVRLEAKAVEDATEYSVQGFTPIERAAVANILETPLNNEGTSWQDVQRGLRFISRPNRRILAISRSVVHATQLRDIQGSTQEVSDMLINNHDSWTKTENIPVFNYSEAQQYAINVLFEHTSEKKLPLMMKEAGVDSQQAEDLYNIIAHVTQSQGAIHELEAITGMGSIENTKAQIEAILSEVDDRYITELIHRLQGHLFIGFPEIAHLEEGALVGGSDDPTALIRKGDVPIAIPPGYTNVRIGAPVGGVVLAGALHDQDRSKEFTRHQVTFYTQMERPVILPKLVWRTTDAGRRTFAFPVSAFERQKNGLARPSSLIGAALSSQMLGHEAGIDYDEALRARIGHRLHRLGRAGLWPLVARYREDAIFENPYFEAIENRLQ